MRKLGIILALSVMPMLAQPAPHGKGWVWADKDDTDGKWHLGARDKRGHYCAGIIAGAVGYKFAELCKAENPRMWGFLLALFVGYAKEVYDMKRGSGTAERADAIWTAAGGATIVSWRW